MRRLMLDQKGRAVEYLEMLAIPDRLTMRIELGSGQLALARQQTEAVAEQPQVREETPMSNAANFRTLLSAKQDDRGARRDRLHHRPRRSPRRASRPST